MRYINIAQDGSVNNIHPQNGTSLMGEITATLDELIATFGNPNSAGDEYKTDVEWVIDTLDGIATIYNWKDGKNYCGEEGEEIENITNWHIGGKNKKVVEHVEHAIQKSSGIVD